MPFSKEFEENLDDLLKPYTLPWPSERETLKKQIKRLIREELAGPERLTGERGEDELIF